MADDAEASSRNVLAMVLDDLARMPTGLVVLAEGWGLRPDLLNRVVEDFTADRIHGSDRSV